MTIRSPRAPRWLVLFATLTLAACSAPPVEPTVASSPAAVAPTTATLPANLPRIEDGRLVLPGRAVPEYSLELGFERSGAVAEVLVRPGDVVKPGDPLARLDSRALQLQVEDAQASLRSARADYERLLSGATPEQIAQAEARLQRARGNLQEVAGAVSEADIAAARQALEASQLRLQQLLRGNTPEAIAEAQARLDEELAALETTRIRASAEKTRAESTLEQAANDLRDAQDRYSRIVWENRSRYGDGEVPQIDLDRENSALREVQNLEEQVAKRQVELEEARAAEITLIQAAEARVREAEADLAEARRGPTPDQIAAARAAVARSQAELAALTGPQRAGAVAEAEGQVAEAQAALDMLLADPSSSDLAVVEARVLRAEVGLKQAELNLAQATLVSPLAGTVASVSIVPGQVIEARDVVIVIASFDSWQVMVEDLSELNIVHIREGDEALIRFFALPELELKGRVSRIEALGRNDANVGTLYSVVITPETWDDRLRWNMTASVTIVPTGS